MSKNRGYFEERIDVSGIRRRKHNRICFLLPSFPAFPFLLLPFSLYLFFSVSCAPPFSLSPPFSFPSSLFFSASSLPFFLSSPPLSLPHMFFSSSLSQIVNCFMAQTLCTTQSKWSINSPQKTPPISSSAALVMRLP